MGGAFVISARDSPLKIPMWVPCNRCIGCRIAKSQAWATRITHEAKAHDRNAFLTLTYSDDKLPSDGGLNPRDLQLFVKRLRKAIEPTLIRFFACGEYGERTLRPHYHMLMFGYDFADKTPWRRSPSGHVLYRSSLLEKTWALGNCETGAVARESAAYCARYCLKKMTGNPAREYYTRPHPITGEVHQVIPEFGRMSNRPGIGADYYEKYKGDIESGYLIHDGKKIPVPQYYRDKLRRERANLDFFDPAKRQERQARVAVKSNFAQHQEDQTSDRLKTREECLQLKLDKLKRQVD